MATGMIQAKPEGSGTYTYSSQPRAVQQGKKYRDQSAYGNIMYDRRIVRGNTYALHTLPASSQPDPLELQRQQESRRRALARKRAREQFKPRSPEPVEGRKHIEVQTELYLEEITDRIEEADVQTQTDAFLDRPSTPLFVPAKTGMDAATQIEDGDLFDFDLEVRPILEVLVGKTVEQALLEVMEEEELASLRAQQRCFEENRNAEVVETQRLEEQERRRREEKDRRMQQQREALLKEKETAEKIAARAFAQSYLADLVPSVFSTLNQNGFFYDPVEREVETVFMPFLMEEMEKSLNKKRVARTLLDAVIRHMVANKLGVELIEPEPVAEPAPPPSTQVESTTPSLKPEEYSKVFGEEKKEEEPAETVSKPEQADTTKEGEPDSTMKEDAQSDTVKEEKHNDAGKEGDAVKEGEASTGEVEATENKEGETGKSEESKAKGSEVEEASEGQHLEGEAPSQAEQKESDPQTENTEATEEEAMSGDGGGEKEGVATSEEAAVETDTKPEDAATGDSQAAESQEGEPEDNVDANKETGAESAENVPADDEQS